MVPVGLPKTMGFGVRRTTPCISVKQGATARRRTARQVPYRTLQSPAVPWWPVGIPRLPSANAVETHGWPRDTTSDGGNEDPSDGRGVVRGFLSSRVIHRFHRCNPQVHTRVTSKFQGRLRRAHHYGCTLMSRFQTDAQ
jgi:hypothetical protein